MATIVFPRHPTPVAVPKPPAQKPKPVARPNAPAAKPISKPVAKAVVRPTVKKASAAATPATAKTAASKPGLSVRGAKAVLPPLAQNSAAKRTMTTKSYQPDSYRDPADRNRPYYIGKGAGSTSDELNSLWNAPAVMRNTLQAAQDGRGTLGIPEDKGNWYLLGGLIDLGAPDKPGAGTSGSWWIPDRIGPWDMSKYFDRHDRNYYGSDVTLGDLGKILKHEGEAFSAGAGAVRDPIHLGLQVVYSAATTLNGIGTAIYNTASKAVSSLGSLVSSLF